MAVIVEREIIEARLRTAEKAKKRLLKRFIRVHGPEQGPKEMEALLERLQRNYQSDSADPNERVVIPPRP